MRRGPFVLLLLLVLALSACGGSSRHAATTTAPAPPQPKPTVEVLYQSSGWRIVRPRQTPVVQRLVGTRWKSVPRTVEISILSPKPKSTTAPIPQIAAEFAAKTPIVEAGIWLDGIELPVRGGGTATRHTFYGAPASNLPAGKQAVIAYARTAKGATVVKWFFTVK